MNIKVQIKNACHRAGFFLRSLILGFGAIFTIVVNTPNGFAHHPIHQQPTLTTTEEQIGFLIFLDETIPGLIQAAATESLDLFDLLEK